MVGPSAGGTLTTLSFRLATYPYPHKPLLSAISRVVAVISLIVPLLMTPAALMLLLIWSMFQAQPFKAANLLDLLFSVAAVRCHIRNVKAEFDVGSYMGSAQQW